MDDPVGKNERTDYQQLVLLFGLLALFAFSMELLRFFERPADNVRLDIWARAPYSDALAPWLVGSLYYVFELPQIQYLYRPTVGLFWGAIIAATERIWLVPQVLGTGFISLLAGLVWIARQSPIGLGLALFLLLFAASAQITFPPLLINTLYIDFAALIFTVAGTWLLIASGDNRGCIGPITASILLGIAAAIRGPMMLGGPVLIVLILGWSAGRSKRLWLACLGVFVVVVGADVLLQRVHQTANNGIESLYCVATDETRSWSPECSARFNRLRPKPQEVINMYVSSVTTIDGLDSLTGGVERRFANDLKVFESSFVRAIIIIWSAFLVSLWILLKLQRRVNPAAGTVSASFSQGDIADWMPSFAVVMLIGATAALNALGARDVAVAMIFIGCLLLIAFASRQRLALSLITSYIGCVLFLALLGYAAAHPRFAGTFSFLLLVAVSLLLVPKRFLLSHASTQVGEVRLLAVCVLLAISFLYLGSRFWPSELRDTFAHSVRGQQAALKLSYEPISDRALYITGSGGVLYTLGDTVPIGSVRRYSYVKYPDRYGNVSLMQPNEFVD